MQKRIAILGGGTVSWVRSHFAVCAPAYGTTAKRLAELCRSRVPKMKTDLYLTRMAGGGKNLETNEDVAALLEKLVNDPTTKVIIFNCAMVDWELGVCDGSTEFPRPNGKDQPRPSAEKDEYNAKIFALEKVIEKIRKERKDIFLVGFKQTENLPEDEQYIKGLDLCKRASCNLVLANDTVNHRNMVITPEEAKYHVTYDREEALDGLVEMVKMRSNLTFTRSTVIAGEPISWNSDLVPESLRKVVDHCIEGGAYKPFRGSTVGHFAVKVNDNTFLTSQRRTDFNDLNEIGLVKIETDGPDTVLAYGAKPSVGGQSQRIVFKDHEGMDCIVHFHCPLKESPADNIPVRSQYQFECGSHECGQNTSFGLAEFGNLKAVYLEEHGPNIVFNRNIDPQEVIDFIDRNFDLSEKTGGYVTLRERVSRPSTADTATTVLD